MTPRVSVVIPAYNAEKYVGAALESVFAQTYKDYEVILVDDGSRDGTPELVQAYLPRVRYVRQDNRGEAAARNAGVALATADLIAFLDADDLWLPEKLRLQVEHMDRHPEHGLVFTDLMRFGEDGVSDPCVLRSIYGNIPSGDLLTWLFRDSLIGSITVVVRKACLERVGLFDTALPIGCDYDMWLRIAHVFKMGYIDESLAMYRQHANNATRNGTLGYECQLRVLRSFLHRHPEFRGQVGASTVRRRLSAPSFDLGRHALMRGDAKRARRHLWTALKLWPHNFRYWQLFLATFLSTDQREALRRLRARRRS